MTRPLVLLILRLDGPGEVSGVVVGVDGGVESTLRTLLLTLDLPLLVLLALRLRLLPGSFGLSEGKFWMGTRLGSFRPTVGLGSA